jgi:hypothetical protein
VLDRAHDDNGQRIRPGELVAESVRFPDPLLHDTILDADCVTRGDHCEPVTDSTTIALFSDSLCAGHLELAQVPTGDCYRHHGVARVHDSTDFALLGTPYTLPVYQLSTGDRCDPYVAPPGVALYTVLIATAPAQATTVYLGDDVTLVGP